MNAFFFNLKVRGKKQTNEWTFDNKIIMDKNISFLLDHTGYGQVL